MWSYYSNITPRATVNLILAVKSRCDVWQREYMADIAEMKLFAKGYLIIASLVAVPEAIRKQKAVGGGTLTQQGDGDGELARRQRSSKLIVRRSTPSTVGTRER